MSMSKKDYVAIARVLAEFQEWTSSNDNPRLIVGDIIYRLSDVCAKDNPRFDRARFLKACGVQS